MLRYVSRQACCPAISLTNCKLAVGITCFSLEHSVAEVMRLTLGMVGADGCLQSWSRSYAMRGLGPWFSLSGWNIDLLLRPPARDRRSPHRPSSQMRHSTALLLARPSRHGDHNFRPGVPHLSPTASVMAEPLVFERRNTRTDCGCSRSPSLDEPPNVDRNRGENRARCLAPRVARDAFATKSATRRTITNKSRARKLNGT
jgi:hypothetical protein